MKRVITAAAGGVLGAAALLSAAPAQAIPDCVPNIACDVVDQAIALPGSIAAQPDQFLNGDGDPESGHVGVLNQPAQFADSLNNFFVAGPGEFVETANPINGVPQLLTGNCTTFAANGECTGDGEHVGLLNQPKQFVTNLQNQPQRFADSIARSIGAFGPDQDEEGDPGGP